MFSDLAYYLFLKGQTLERTGTHKMEILEIQEEAIKVLEALGKPYCENLAQLYKVKGAILEFLGRCPESVTFFNLSIGVYSELGYH